MRGAFLLDDLAGVVELLAIVIFALTGFVAAVAAISVRTKPSGTASDDTMSKALENRNEFRRLLRFLFSFGASLVFMDILVRFVEFPVSPPYSALSLFLAFLAFALLAYVCVRTYRFVWHSTVISATFTASETIHMSANATTELVKARREPKEGMPQSDSVDAA
jgi:quinol-cytochrome oxidoreductase complex cytochrome b subunit